MGKSCTAVFTNMVMITDRSTGKVLVQCRTQNWKGPAFPGGHVEPRESFTDSAIREVKEETGLTIWNLRLCGQMHWVNMDNDERYIVNLYKTEDFNGELISMHEEGENKWMTLDEFRNAPSENTAVQYLPIFMGEYNEAFCAWRENEPYKLEYR